MKNTKTLRNLQIISAIFSIVLGIILHFSFEWSNKNYVVGFFSSVNESTWEHLKLIFFPMFFSTLIGYFYIGKSYPNYLCSKTIGILSALIFITIFFYTYTGVIGTNYAFIDILSFFVAVILGEFISYILIRSNFSCNNRIPVFVLFILLLCFILFTYFTPKINYFKDPITNSYGISNL